MITPIVEQIAQKLQQRLGLIDEANGSQTTAADVVRPTRLGGFHPDDYQLICLQDTRTRNAAFSCPGNPPAIAWNQPFKVRAELLPSKKDRRPIDLIRNQFAADTEQAIATGQKGDWAQWDGLAIYSEISDATPYTEDGDTIAGFEVVVLVIYRTSENNPYELR